MRKKLCLCALALLGLLAVNLNVSWQVAVDGQMQEGLYSRRQLVNCKEQAAEAAEEILHGPAQLPKLKARWRLSLRQPQGDEKALADALLRGVHGVRLSDAVLVNGTKLGTVEDGEKLMEKLRASIRAQMPNAAVFGNISGKVQVRKLYVRDGSDTPDEDMILLITGMAPVIYVDKSGKIA